MFIKIRSIFKFYVIGFFIAIFKSIKMAIEYTKSYKAIDKFLKQYKDRAIMIRVTPAQAKLLIGCTQIGILNINDLCKATGAMIVKKHGHETIIFSKPSPGSKTVIFPGGRRSGKASRTFIEAERAINKNKNSIYISKNMVCMNVERYSKLIKLEGQND